ncbi:T9SS type A sorting domain-containing protein [Hymenobacter lapidiphilus]|uniref:T9SS type A sorting domain-containing protein n=1 Tax=Hymenobacter lapidiphilus TaxID=2608003 RepID=A0A7Y7PQ23_9BACT|nr:T9SS type A sorting domain-containing protein [Hymenobacter lapidiphilus]NVO31959.1 T9SS type A sorting domain-containing protein [Hymenobacter lapidiphilus]
MKKQLYLLVAAAGLPLVAHAQTTPAVANGNLETWQPRNLVEAPAAWITADDLLASLGLPPIVAPRTVTKAGDAHGGSFAAKLQNQALALRGTGTARQLAALRKLPRPLARRDDELTLPGVLLKASFNEDGELVNGVPYTGRPARLQFWYKLTGSTVEADSSVAFLALLNKSTPVAAAAQILLPKAAYTLMDVPITYLSGLQPDTLALGFGVATAGENDPTVQMFIDDVQLVGAVTGNRTPVAAAALQVYPNPSATGEFSLASLTDAALSTAPLTVTDATGRLVLRQAAAAASESRGRLVDLRAQRPGVYLLRLEAPTGPVVRKLVVQ